MAKKSKMDRGLDSLFFDNSIDEVTRSDSESVKMMMAKWYFHSKDISY